MMILFGILVGFSFLVSVPLSESKNIRVQAGIAILHTLSSISVGIAAALLFNQLGS